MHSHSDPSAPPQLCNQHDNNTAAAKSSPIPTPAVAADSTGTATAASLTTASPSFPAATPPPPTPAVPAGEAITHEATVDLTSYSSSPSDTLSATAASTIPRISAATIGYTSAPSHKRGREPSAMTDPSEAARYTPPREMFRHPSAILDSDELLSQPSLDSLQDGETENQTDIGLNQKHQLQQNDHAQPDGGFHGDSEIDHLGQQLSINSPEKMAVVSIDQEQDQRVQDGPSDTTDSHTVQECQRQGQGLTSQPDVPSFAEQQSIIMRMTHKRLEENDIWYLISSSWFASFRKYCTKMAHSGVGDHPGPIDNSLLFMGNNLREGIQNSVTTVPEEGWEKLVAWYGTSTAPIMRRVVNTATELSPNLIIDYYPPSFTIYKVVESSQAEDPMFAMNEPDTLEVSRSTKFSDLKSALLTTVGVIGPGPARLWVIPKHANLSVEGNVIGADSIRSLGATCLEHIEDEATLAEIPELVKGGDIAVEASVNGVYLVSYSPRIPVFDSSMFSSYPRILQGSRASSSSMSSPGMPANGICGLSNLGNTCFMNSALQCLSNAPDLTRYILAGAWRDELNLDNPLGMGGEVARAYANLIDKLWNGSSKVFSPREFKSTIGRFAPSFTGYHQHDSQELLAFLLDGLHEDLNRIIKKPYTEMPESKGRPDEEVANEFWQIHKARNDSIVVDLFQGQYKSTLVCPECKKVSVTFDPFMYLSLPLPISKKWVGTVTYVPYDPKKPVVDIQLQLPKGSTQKQLKEKVAELIGTQASHLYSAEIFSNRLYKSHDNADAVDELGDTDKTFLYELPVPDFTNAPDHVVFPVLSMLEPITSYGRINTFGHPMMVCVTKEEALDPDAIYKAIVKQASRYTTLNLYEGDCSTSPEEKQSEELGIDVDMSPSDEIAEEKEKLPQSGLFRLMVFTPPTPQPSRYQVRSITRTTLYAPAIPPSMGDMVDMYQRILPQEPESEQEEEMAHIRTHNQQGLSMDENEDDGLTPFGRLGSPSTLSGSSRSSSRPRVPLPDPEDLSEDDDVATLPVASKTVSQFPSHDHGSPVVPVRKIQLAIMKGEMVYCVWSRSLESSISLPERRYRSYRSIDEEEEEQESGVRVLWNQRGTPVVDPVLQEELSTEKKGKKVITLEDCLNEYTKEEQLGEEDLWYCPNCKKHQQATKKLDIWRLPEILVVHLKRFSHTRAWRDKIDAFVDFPIHGLDLSAKALKEEDQDDNVYDLFGVSNHMGGLGGGHYTAYAKNEKLDQWYNFDDSHVSPVGDVELIKSSSAYLLFYRKRNAAVREYEQRPAVAEPEPSVAVNSVPQFHGGGYLESFGTHSILSRRKDNDDDELYGAWGKPPSEPDQFADMSSMDRTGFSDDDSDLPPYTMIGPSGMASPPSSFSGRLTFMSDKRHDNEDVDEANTSGYLASHGDRITHSPSLSTCASNGSNPGTANVSPDFSPALEASTISEYPPRMDLPLAGPSLLSKISKEGGRIDGGDEMEGDIGQRHIYGARGTGAGIPTPSSMLSGVESKIVDSEAEPEVEGKEDEQDGVNMVE
ncbi:CSN-associated deubiquitinating enzyme Ubp12 [Mortierella claussenii]|nr:CSN-associated deubiquitinating enzyme Ubp12 [Mortierella claussenii]